MWKGVTRRGGFAATYVTSSTACGGALACGGHGTCADGACQCDPGYGGLQCTLPHCADKAPAASDVESLSMLSQPPGLAVPAEAGCVWTFRAPATAVGVQMLWRNPPGFEPTLEGLDANHYTTNAGNTKEEQNRII